MEKTAEQEWNEYIFQKLTINDGEKVIDFFKAVLKEEIQEKIDLLVLSSSALDREMIKAFNKCLDLIDQVKPKS